MNFSSADIAAMLADPVGQDVTVDSTTVRAAFDLVYLDADPYQGSTANGRPSLLIDPVYASHFVAGETCTVDGTDYPILDTVPVTGGFTRVILERP